MTATATILALMDTPIRETIASVYDIDRRNLDADLNAESRVQYNVLSAIALSIARQNHNEPASLRTWTIQRQSRRDHRDGIGVFCRFERYGRDLLGTLTEAADGTQAPWLEYRDLSIETVTILPGWTRSKLTPRQAAQQIIRPK